MTATANDPAGVRALTGIVVGIAQGAWTDAAIGYAGSSTAMQSLWSASSSFASVIAVSRVGNHLREVQRQSPKSRAVGRLLKRGFTSNDTRVHHYLPGLAVGFAAGGVAILSHQDRRSPWLAAVYGAGVGLTTDELRVLAGRSDPYWGGQRFALAQAAAATGISIALTVRFARRGKVQRLSRMPASPHESVDGIYRALSNGYSSDLISTSPPEPHTDTSQLADQDV